MEKSLKFIAKNFGLYLGITLTVLMILAYLVNLDLFVNFWYGISIYLITIIFGIIAYKLSANLIFPLLFSFIALMALYMVPRSPSYLQLRNSLNRK